MYCISSLRCSSECGASSNGFGQMTLIESFKFGFDPDWRQKFVNSFKELSVQFSKIFYRLYLWDQWIRLNIPNHKKIILRPVDIFLNTMYAVWSSLPLRDCNN